MNKKETNELLRIFQTGNFEDLKEFSKCARPAYFQNTTQGRTTVYRKTASGDITQYNDVVHKPSGERFVFFALKFSNFELLKKLESNISEHEIRLLGRYLGGNIKRYDTWFENYSRSDFYLSKVRMKLLMDSIINTSYNKFSKDVMMRILKDDINAFDRHIDKQDTKRKELVAKIINRKKVLKNIIE